MSKFRRLAKRESVFVKTNKNLIRTLHTINRIQTTYQIPYYIIIDSFLLYKDAKKQKKFKRSNPEALIGAILHYYLTKNQRVLQLGKLAEFIGTDKKKIFKQYNRIIKQFDLDPPALKPLTILDHFLNKLKLQGLKLPILRAIKRKKINFQRKNPFTLFGALIFLVARAKGLEITKKKLSKTLNLTANTIRNNIVYLKENYGVNLSQL